MLHFQFYSSFMEEIIIFDEDVMIIVVKPTFDPKSTTGTFIPI
jgi:hypothetical protein